MQVHVKLNIKYDSKYFFFKLDLHLMKCLKEKKRIKIVATWFLTHIKYFDTFNICILYFFKKYNPEKSSWYADRNGGILFYFIFTVFIAL